MMLVLRKFQHQKRLKYLKNTFIKLKSKWNHLPNQQYLPLGWHHVPLPLECCHFVSRTLLYRQWWPFQCTWFSPGHPVCIVHHHSDAVVLHLAQTQIYVFVDVTKTCSVNLHIPYLLWYGLRILHAGVSAETNLMHLCKSPIFFQRFNKFVCLIWVINEC